MARAASNRTPRRRAGATRHARRRGEREPGHPFAALADRTCRIVIYVKMLGERFDLCQLKIAALPDVNKSLRGDDPVRRPVLPHLGQHADRHRLPVF